MDFGGPLAQWLPSSLRKRMNEYSASAGFEEPGLDLVAARRLWAEFVAGRAHRPDQLWPLYILGSWMRTVQATAAGASV